MNTDKMVFVFGSNLAGIHGAGAARFAYEKRGALLGIATGPTGQSYAVPTKGMKSEGGRFVIGPTLTLPIIKKHIDDFIEYAKLRPDLKFQVTRLGCGLAGLRDEDIAPMFKEAPKNCFFDEVWGPILGRLPATRFWGTF